jgi:dihydroorotate dehydrogenase (fumarate)
MNLQTTYLGLDLAHPIIASASPLSATLDGIRRLEDAGSAAIVTSTLYEEEMLAAKDALQAVMTIGAESHPEVTTYLPPLSGRSDQGDAHIELVRRAAESVSVPVVASLSGTTRAGWIDLAAGLESAGAAAIEINTFYLPIDPVETSASAEARLIGVVRDVRAAVRIPLAVKLGHSFTAPAHLARSLAEEGANGVVLFNRFYVPELDLRTMTFRPALELSRRPDSRLPLMWIALLAGKTPLSLGASGGVETADDAVRYLLAGADAVLTASALLRHGPEYMGRLVKGLADWLEAHGAGSVAQIRGRMSANRLAHPEVLVRAQHTPTLLRECPCRDVAPRPTGP